MSHRHVFILGAGRSGTKILRDCLGAASDVACIPYDIGFVWRYGNESIPHDELIPENLTRQKIDVIKSGINRLGKRASKNRKFQIILEKSVPNSLRPLFLKTVFPEAKLIYVVRDGRNVIESSMRNWEKPSDTGYMWDKLRYFPLRSIPYAVWYAKNKLLSGSSSQSKLWGPRYCGMQEDANDLSTLEVCTRQWIKCVENCDLQLAKLSPSDVLRVKYEDIVADVEKIRSICGFAQISDRESVESFYKKHVHSRGGVGSRLTDEQLEYINDVANEILLKHGYI